MRVSIIMPAHNEERRIQKTLESYLDFFTKLKKNKMLDFEIIVVLNGCKDSTKDVVMKKPREELRVIEYEQAGKGFAIARGFENALTRKNDIIGFVDSDLATPPEEFYKLIKNIKNSDGVIASRYVLGAIILKKQSFLRSIASRVFNFTSRSLFLFNYRDTQCGAKIFRWEAIEKILPHLSLTEWAFDVGLLYQMKKNKFRIKEFPTYWKNMEGSKLKVGKVSLQMLFSILQLRILNSRFDRLIKPVKPFAGILWKMLK